MGLVIYEMEDLRDVLVKYANGEDDLNKVVYTREQAQEIKNMSLNILATANTVLTEKVQFAGSFGAEIRRFVTYDIPAPMAVNSTKAGLSINLNLFINPKWLAFKQGVVSEGVFVDDFKNISAILLHEYEHLLYNHLGLYEYYVEQGQGELVNWAADGAINQDPYIMDAKDVSNYGITLDALRKRAHDNSLKPRDDSFEYFKALVKASQKNQQQGQGNGQGQNQQQSQGNGQGNSQGQNQQQGQGNSQGQNQQQSQGQGQGNGQGNGQQGQNQQQSQSQGQGNGQQGQNQQQGQGQGNVNGQQGPLNPSASHKAWSQTPEDVKELQDESTSSSKDIENTVTDRVKRVMREGHIDADSLKSRGLVAGSILDAVLDGEAGRGRLPLKSIVQKGAGRLRFGEHKTYSRINHQQGARVDIRRGIKQDNQKNLRVFCDNSGSMSNDEINWAVQEIAAVAKRIRAKLEIVPFDAEVYPENKQFVEKSGKFHYVPAGRGGTSFQPIFNYLKDETKANNRDDLIIILSDGYGEGSIDYRGFRNIVWVLVEQENDTLSVNDPIGQVAWLSDDNKYVFHKMRTH